MCTDMCRRVVGGVRVRHYMVLLIVFTMTLWASAFTRAWAQSPVPATLVQAATPMIPYLDWLVDPSGALTVEDMAAPAQQADFRPLNMEKIPRESGNVWLRFTLAPRVVDTRPSTYLLDMGEGVPGTPTLYIPKHNVLNDTTSWQDLTPSQRSIFVMPDAQTSPVTAYIKMSGMPGLWFAPMLRTPHNAATALERLLRPAVIVVLGVVMLLCLLRGLAERGEWRFWTSLYTGAALLHSVWGVPTLVQGAIPMEEIAAVLAPGVALMLLPHVGRHLMRTREKSRIIDVQYLLLALPGAALGLLPLLPGFSWTIRYLDLWPLGTLLLVPTTLGAWLMGLTGARRFLLGCLLPPLATALGLAGIGANFPAPLLATAPLWGVALSALIIAGTAVTYEPDESAVAHGKDDPLHDPALRIVTPEELAQEANAPMPEPVAWEKNAPPRAACDSVALAWEEKLRGPLDTLLREGAALGACSLPPVARQHAQSLQETVGEMVTLLSQPLEGQDIVEGIATDDSVCFDLQQLLRDAHDYVATNAENKNIALSWFMPPHLPNRFLGDGRRLALCVRLLLESAVRATSRGGVQLSVRRVPESVDAGHLLFSVTDTGAGMPPHDRSSMAVARAWELAAVYRGFLGVECSPHGTSVSFTVRLGVATAVAPVAGTSANDTEQTPTQTMPDLASTPLHMAMGDPQQVGQGGRDASGLGEAVESMPTLQPITGALNDAAPLASTSGDAVGTSMAVEAKAPARVALPRIIIADDSLSNRQLLAFFLEGLPYTTVEARSPDEAVELYTASPAALIIFDGDMPEDDTLNAVTRIRAFEAEYGLPAALVLALTTDDSRWEVLHYGGFTHALVKPVSRTGLRRTVQELLPEGTVVVPPLSMAFGAMAGPMGTETSNPDMDTDVDNTPAPFAISEAERILQEQAATSAAWLDESIAEDKPADSADEEDIIDTGAPLPEPEPLRMSPASAPAHNNTTSRSANERGMVLPMMESVPSAPPLQDLPDMRSMQVMPELAPLAAPEASAPDMTTPAPVKTAPVKVGAPVGAIDEDDAGREEMYPHHAASTVDGGAEQASAHAVASLDAPAYTTTRTIAPPTAASDASAVPAAAGSASPQVGVASPILTQEPLAPVAPTQSAAPVESLEWVGEPMPVGSVPSARPASPSRPSVSAIPSWMRDSVASHADTATSHAPSGLTEWVGEPMPITKAAPSSSQPSAAAKPAEARVTETAPTEGNHSAPISPDMKTGTNGSSVDVLEISDEPSKIEDLLKPYTASSFVAQDVALAMDNDMPADELPPVVHRPSFIPLSFDNDVVQTAEQPAPSPLATAPLVSSEIKQDNAPRVALNAEAKKNDPPKQDRLSLIPEESSLMDFIISSPEAQASSPVADQTPSPQPATPQPVAPQQPAPKTITITAGPTPRAPKVTTTTVSFKSNTAKNAVSAADTSAVPAAQAVQAASPASAINPVPAAPQAAPQAPPVQVRPAAAANTVQLASSAQPVSPVNRPASAVVTPPVAQAAVPPTPSAVAPAPVPPHDSPIPTMLKEFDEAMAYARGGFARKNIQAVQDSAEYIATRSETCGLRVLARMARCVGEAAKASDTEALNNLLPELETAVERNKIALMKK